MTEEVRLLVANPPDLMPGGERVIDVMVWGASRPALLQQTIETFRAHAKADTVQLRYFLEDGAFDADGAAEAVRIAEGFGFDGIHVERVGSYGWAMTNAMNRWCRAPLMFSLEDDYRFLRDIDFDLCWEAFAQNSGLNQLRYNRRTNVAAHTAGIFPFPRRTLSIDSGDGVVEYPVLGSRHWYFNPAVWRMSFIRPRWRGFQRNVHHALNSGHGLLPPSGETPSPEWYADVLGVLTWGDVGEPPFMVHAGREASIHKAQGFV